MLDIATKKLTKLTESLTPEIDAAELVDAQVVRFKARDGMDDPEHPVEAASGDVRRQRRRPSSGFTAGPAARRRRRTTRCRSTS